MVDSGSSPCIYPSARAHESIPVANVRSRAASQPDVHSCQAISSSTLKSTTTPEPTSEIHTISVSSLQMLKRSATEQTLYRSRKPAQPPPAREECSLPFNSFDRQHEPTCLENTSVDILYEIYTWTDGQDKRCIFWLNGLAGTGKSTIACTIARRYFENRRLGASFFFTKGEGDAGHAGKFVTSVAIELANSVPTLRQYICDAVIERSDIASQSLRDRWHQLVLRPLSKLDGSNCHSSYVSRC
jgi:hypothetical protein